MNEKTYVFKSKDVISSIGVDFFSEIPAVQRDSTIILGYYVFTGIN